MVLADGSRPATEQKRGRYLQQGSQTARPSTVPAPMMMSSLVPRPPDSARTPSWDAPPAPRGRRRLGPDDVVEPFNFSKSVFAMHVAHAVDKIANTEMQDGSSDPLQRIAHHLERRENRGVWELPPVDQGRSTRWVEKNRKLLEEVLPLSLAHGRGNVQPLQAASDYISFSARSISRGEAVRSQGITPCGMHMGVEKWNFRGGRALEWLLDGDMTADPPKPPPVALIRADFLVEFATTSASCPARQDLPEEAFVTLQELQAATHAMSPGLHGAGLPILVLSYPWLTKTHPDPFGAHLKRIAELLKTYVRPGDTWGVFWDFMSMYQHPDESKEIYRSPEKERLFQTGIEGMSLFYTHPQTTVLRVTSFPDDFPQAYDLPEGYEPAMYDKRGWCFTEQCWSTLTKPASMSLDVGAWSGRFDYLTGAITETKKMGRRPPPLTPDGFERAISGKIFGNGKEDRPTLIRLYAKSFEATFLRVRELEYDGLQWDDRDVQMLVSVLRYKGGLPCLTKLSLRRNHITDVGAGVLAKITGELPCIGELDLSYNRIGARGMKAVHGMMKEFSERPIGGKVIFRLIGNRVDAPVAPLPKNRPTFKQRLSDGLSQAKRGPRSADNDTPRPKVWREQDMFGAFYLDE